MRMKTFLSSSLRNYVNWAMMYELLKRQEELINRYPMNMC